MQPTLEALFARYREHRHPRDLAAVFDRCAPELWRVGYHLCGSRTEADDLLQATFLVAMQSASRWRPEDPLVPWLCGILTNKLRMQRRRARQVVPARDSARASDDPSEAAERSELRAMLQQRIGALEEPYRAVLVLQLENGLSPAEIAHALGRSRATVRSQLQRGLELLRRGLPVGLFGGAAGAMTVPQLSVVRAAVLAASAAEVATGSLWTLGAMWMAKKLMLAAAALALVVTGVWWAWPAPPSESAAAKVAAASDKSDSPNAQVSPTVVAKPGLAERTEVVPPTSIPGSAPGSLKVAVHWADGTPAAGTRVSLGPSVRDGGFLYQRWAHANDAGVAEWRDLTPGMFVVRAQHGGEIEAEVSAGAATSCELTIPQGVDVRGVVVDQDGVLVPGATIAMGPRTSVTSDCMVPVTTADGNGAFVLRSVPSDTFVNAFAELHHGGATESVADLLAKQPVQLQVWASGTPLEGRVVDSRGAPIADAWVAEGSLAFRAGQPGIQLVQTDAAGRFRLLGLHSQYLCSLHAGAPRFATWHSVRRLPTSPMEIVLEAEAVIRGTARTADGVLVPNPGFERIIDTATPKSGMVDGRPRWCTARPRGFDDGTFRIDQISPGKVQVAMHDRLNKLVAYREFDVKAGEEIVWDAVLAERPTMHGRIVDEAEKPLVGWRVMAEGPDNEPSPFSEPTGIDGRFTLPRCLPATYVLYVYGADKAWNPPVHTVSGVVPGMVEIVVRVPRTAVPSCQVRGVLRAPGAKGDITVQLSQAMTGNGRSTAVADGQAFAVGPVPSGRYTIYITVEDGGTKRMATVVGAVDLAPGADLDLGIVTLPEPGEIAVELLDSEGKPVAKAELGLRLWDSSHYWGELVPIEAGKARLQALPGTYCLTPRLGDEFFEHPPFVVRSGETTTVRVQLRKSVTRHFEFDIPMGPMEGMRLLFEKQGVPILAQPHSYSLPTGDKLELRFTPGTWELVVTLADGRTEHFPFVVTSDAEAPPIGIRITR